MIHTETSVTRYLEKWAQENSGDHQSPAYLKYHEAFARHLLTKRAEQSEAHSNNGRFGSLLRRFDDKVYPDPNSGCWIWAGGSSSKGYGVFYWPGGPNPGGLVPAHRASYLLFVGDIPDQYYVLHKCDTPCCVNPDHLRTGTQQDNLIEMESRQRGAKGRSGLPRGVRRAGKRFAAQYSRNNVTRALGTFDTAEDAHTAAEAARRSSR